MATAELRHVALSAWTTLGVGGRARRMVEVAGADELASVLSAARAAAEPVLFLGQGSNVVVSDDGFDGTVVRLAMRELRAQADGAAVRVVAGAGVPWSELIELCLAEGLAGLECLAGIPGLVGAAPVQNVGAYGQEVSATVGSVAVWDRLRGQARTMAAPECGFAYRDSVFKRNDRYVVTAVEFLLRRSRASAPVRYQELADHLGTPLGGRAPLGAVSEAVLGLRRAKGMVLDPADPDTRSVGSFFTNPVLAEGEIGRLARLAPGLPRFPAPGGTKVPAAWLVEQAGFRKGLRHGTAAISTKHALALTALPGARAADVMALARQVRDGVRQRFGVVLEPEPVLVNLRL